jgi:integrase
MHAKTRKGTQGEDRRGKRRRGDDRFEPRRCEINGEPYWQVNWSEIEIRDGQQVHVRRRKTFRDYEEAKTAADQARIAAKNSGKNAFTISDRLRVEAQQAEQILKPFEASIIEAAKFYADHLGRIRTSQKVSVAVKEFLKAKKDDHPRPRYLSDLRARLTRFSESFGERPIAGVSAGELNAWLRSLGVKAATRNSYRLRLGVLFSYAIECGWAKENPVRAVKKLKTSTITGILTPEEFARLLEAAASETLPYWLLGGFAGLRRAEIERLEWKDIRFDVAKYRTFNGAIASGDPRAIAKVEKEWRDEALIEVPALKSKTASRRFVQIQDNLAAWLEPYIGRTGKVCPPTLRRLMEIDRLNAGFKPTALGIKQMKQMNIRVDPLMFKDLKKWPSNGLRHSFASYHLAHFKNAALLALELGHTDQDLIFRHYRELVKPDQSAKWWSIRPAAQTNLVAISA